MKINSDLLNNTVSAQGQLKDTQYISFNYAEGAVLKVLFVGNSITRHGVLEEIGWNRDCGMAASCLEKDYVHLVVKGLEEKYGKISYCVTHAVEWERAFDKDGEILAQFSPAVEFDADIVVLRIGENSDVELAKTKDYYKHFDCMAKFFFSSRCKKIVTSLFWRFDPFDIPIERVAKDNGYVYVSIDKYGDMDEMKALTEFSHGGVAKHPNDNGMRAIADEILKVL